MKVHGKTVSEVLLSRQDTLAQTILARQYELQPGLQERYGEYQHEMALQDTRYNLIYLAEALSISHPGLFVDYIAWLRAVLEKRGVPLDDLRLNLECILSILLQELPAEVHNMLTEYVQTAAAQLVAGRLPADEPLVRCDMPHGVLAVDYLDALLAGQRRRAVSLALDAVEDGLPIEDLYLQVFQPVQHEIGRLWQINEISVAQEHYATAVTQLVMSQLYPRIFATERNGHTLVAACVGNELHEIGIRMVADLFELHGWDTFYLGANTPVASVVETVEEHRADLLAVSVTMTLHLQQVERLIEAVRVSTVGGVKILVGGYPFNLIPNLWQQFGADGYAPDAKRAISLAATAVGGKELSG